MPFVTFEGSEGCGKSTHGKRLAARLENNGVDATVFRETRGNNCFPDLTFVLASDRATAQLRLGHREKIHDRMEEESEEFYERVICACRDLARNEAQPLVLVNARPSADMVETEIWNLLVRRFPEFENKQISTATLQSS